MKEIKVVNSVQDVSAWLSLNEEKIQEHIQKIMIRDKQFFKEWSQAFKASNKVKHIYTSLLAEQAAKQHLEERPNIESVSEVDLVVYANRRLAPKADLKAKMWHNDEIFNISVKCSRGVYFPQNRIVPFKTFSLDTKEIRNESHTWLIQKHEIQSKQLNRILLVKKLSETKFQVVYNIKYSDIQKFAVETDYYPNCVCVYQEHIENEIWKQKQEKHQN